MEAVGQRHPGFRLAGGGMRSLNRKLLRDLYALKTQAAAIATVIAAGVMTLIVFVTTLDSLALTQERFYRDFQFASVFADLKRAPNSLEERLRELPGINHVESRVRAPVRMDVPGFGDPVRGEIVSLPEGRQPNVNRLFVRKGTLPDPGRFEEVAVNEVFAEAHGLDIGDSLTVIIRGRMETVRIAGIVLSPEFVYQLGPADLVPDYERYGVLWMNRRALANAFGMEGAFNNVVATLQVGAVVEPVIDALDELLAPYGGVGAYGREDQMSHRFVSDELEQVRAMATILPAVFLGVAAFLLHVLVGRIVRTQREQVAVLKAFGYTNGEIALHYAFLTGLIVLAGAVAGIVLGAWAADALGRVYLEYFRFPELSFRLQGWVIALAVLVAGGAAFFGAFGAVRGAARLPPAEAMRPPAPERFHRGLLERSPLWRFIGQPTRIILRNLSRHPWKAVLSVSGIALSGALLVVGSYQFGAVNHMLDVQYRLVQKMDIHLTFTDPTPERALGELRHRAGVQHVEGYRSVPVRLVNGVRYYQTGLLGLEEPPGLRGMIDRDHRPVSLPPEGVLMTRYLADYLRLAPGDEVDVEILEGHRRHLRVPLAGTVDEPIGVGVYMERRALNGLMREGPAISGAWLLTDRESEKRLFDELWDMSRVASIGLIGDAERIFREHMEGTVLVFMGVVLLLACSIAFGVIYNNARIALAERTRELATLRVLGFTRGEAGWILIGEILLLTLVAIPLGWALGTLFAFLLSHAMSVDMYRVPFIVTRWTYGFSAAGVFGASILSILLVAPRIRHLDMVLALKAGE